MGCESLYSVANIQKKWRSAKQNATFLYRVYNLACFSHYESRYFIIEMWLKISASTIIPTVSITNVSISLQSFTGVSLYCRRRFSLFPQQQFITSYSILIPTSPLAALKGWRFKGLGMVFSSFFAMPVDPLFSCGQPPCCRHAVMMAMNVWSALECQTSALH